MEPIILILASGQGRRFRAAGGATHKLQADLGGREVLARTLDAAQASGLAWHLERASHPGMGDALAAAVRATAAADGWLILPADMPLVLPATMQQVARALEEGAQAAFPVVDGRRGHPVGFAAAQRERLMALSGDEGARSILGELRAAGLAREIASTDAGALEDIDTPQDLQRAQALWRARQALDA
ncbi:NTP transferase domain-containing protein [Xylophilus rhododendri]|uniref:NTP transferase domain-containing protein n=1 Tax=Xylophilus rhododendri TaxID=2697032 RepID=A0A857J252_9BURK|nr:NTP transferase domain-containing protein [Xylophilus rhododendri]QHI97151.1 NTP transferase domain-containing protein [Xylophilus rhododendri]